MRLDISDYLHKIITPPPDFQTFRRPWDVSHTRHHAGLLLIVSARYAAEPCFFILQSESETF